MYTITTGPVLIGKGRIVQDKQFNSVKVESISCIKHENVS